VTSLPFSEVIEEIASIVGLQATSTITDSMRKQWAEEKRSVIELTRKGS
jgi:putative DNA primase/helicase